MPNRTTRLKCSYIWAVCVSLSCLPACLAAPGESDGSNRRETPIVKAVRRARASVANIRGEKTLPSPGPETEAIEAGRRVNGMGTGVVIDPRGYIVTNYHVVDGVRQINVTLADGKKCIARMIARDLETDLAVIKIDVPSEIPAIVLGTSSDLMPGETVIAVGNAFGYEHTVTRGIISALHRSVQVSDVQFYEDLIQTDASINPGNSGGPLLNIDGEMIGINVAVRAGAQGIGFAIPADKAIAVVARLLADGNAQQTWHGVVPAADSGIETGGLPVASVASKSPAAAGGLTTGDLITEVDDLEIKRALDFHRAMLERKAGDKVKLVVRRDGKPVAIQLTLAKVLRKHTPWDVLGLELEAIPTKSFRRTYQTRYRGGLRVVNVRTGSPAAEQGIHRGDVLVGMHIWETVSLDNVAYILKRPDFARLCPIKFFILRGNETLFGHLPLAARTARRE